jgi:hypothetical protein
MIDVIASCGPGFKGPSFHDIRGSLLQNEVQRINEYLIEFKESWTKTGCTIMSDGWTDGRSRTILNFLIACPKGTMFLKSVDASDQVKDAQLLFHLLDEVVVEVGVQNVVQVITDNASNYVAAGRMLEEKHPTIWWTPCVDLDPLPQPEVQIPSGPGESSGIHNPHVGSQSIHVEDEEDEDSDD